MNKHEKTSMTAFAVLSVAFMAVLGAAAVWAEDADAARATLGSESSPVSSVDIDQNDGYWEIYAYVGSSVTITSKNWTPRDGTGIDVPLGWGLTGDDSTMTVTGTLTKAGSINLIWYTNYEYEQSDMWIYAVEPLVSIDSVGGTDATVGYQYSYTVQTTPSDATVSISGVSWLSVSGHTVSGTPTTAGSYTLKITASKDGYTSATETVVIVVSAAASSQGAPTISSLTYAVDPSNPYRLTFTVSASDASSITVDYGDGVSGSGAATTHTYTASGSYTVIATAANSAGTATASVSVLIADSVPDSHVAYNGQYTFTLGIDTAGQNVSLAGCPFLTVATGSNYVTVSGSPTSTAYVGVTYDVTLTVGSFSMSWTLTVDEGATFPVAGFTYEASGLDVTITSTASNADLVYYDFGDGKTTMNNSSEFTHPYDEEGVYVITQTVYAYTGGSTQEDVFTATVVVSAIADAPAESGDDGGDGDNGDDNTTLIAGVIIAIAGIAVLLAGAYIRNQWAVILGVVLALIGVVVCLL